MIIKTTEDRNIKAGDIVCHFKSSLHPEDDVKKYLYMILGLAHHSETGEDMVVYQSLSNKGKICVRPYNMFMSVVDKDKYPAATATYRFEKIKTDDSSINKASQDIVAAMTLLNNI